MIDIAVDLGTSKVAVAYLRGGPEIIPFNGKPTAPNVLAFVGDEWVFGDEALVHREHVVAPHRHLGGNWSCSLAGSIFSATNLTAVVLRQVRKNAEAHLGEPITRVLLTCPASSTSAYVEDLREAAKRAGLAVSRILPEAVAVAACNASGSDGITLIFDMGGSRLDCSVVDMFDCRILGLASTIELGGARIDDRLVDHVAEQSRRLHGVDIRSDGNLLARIRPIAERAKIELSKFNGTPLECVLPGGLKIDIALTRSELESLISDLVDRTIEFAEDAIQSAGIRRDEIDRIVLSGGSTFIPLVQKRLTDHFGLPATKKVDPSLAVALGAALCTRDLPWDDKSHRVLLQPLPEVTTDRRVRVRGTTTPNAIVTIEGAVSGVQATIDQTGGFNLEIELRENDVNELLFRSTSPAGESTVAMHRVRHVNKVPAIEAESPAIICPLLPRSILLGFPNDEIRTLIPAGVQLPLAGQLEYPAACSPGRDSRILILEGYSQESEIPHAPFLTQLGSLPVRVPIQTGLPNEGSLIVHYEIDERRNLSLRFWASGPPEVVSTFQVQVRPPRREQMHLIERAELAVNEAGERLRPEEKARLNRRRMNLIDLCEQYVTSPTAELRGEIVESGRQLLAVVRSIEERVLGYKPLVVDENVRFTVYRPNAIEPDRWYDLLAFAHLTERLPDAPKDSPDPVREVERQASQVLGTKLPTYQALAQDSTQAIPREGEITFVPEVSGLIFNPPRRSFLWVESVHRADFRVKANRSLAGTVARGRITAFLGTLLIADIPLTLRVDAHVPDAETAPVPQNEPVKHYRKVFASYSHKDLPIVEQVESYIRMLGDEVLRDWKHLRAGEQWNDRLRDMIREADVFQLFWSSNSMRSDFCRQEWEYALALNRPHFVRPTYWEVPMPSDSTQGLPPETLSRLHFQRICCEIDAPATEERNVASDKVEQTTSQKEVPPPKDSSRSGWASIGAILSKAADAVRNIRIRRSRAAEARLDSLAGRRSRLDPSDVLMKQSFEDRTTEGWPRKIEQWIAHADVNITPRRLILISAGFGVLGGVAAAIFYPLWFVIVLATLLPSSLPWLWLGWMRQRRLRRFAALFPEAIRHVSQSLHQGESLTQALAPLSKDKSSPVAREFDRALMEMNLGIALLDSLQSAVERTPVFSFQMFALAISIQRQTGGDLAESLDRILEILTTRRAFPNSTSAPADATSALSKTTRLSWRRRRALRRAFPRAVDVLLVCLHSGDSLDTALRRTGEYAKASCPKMAEELSIVSFQIQMGQPRTSALRQFGRRSGVAEIESFIESLAEADRKGESILAAARVASGLSKGSPMQGL